MLFQPTLREIPEEGRSHVHRGRIVKALNFKSFVKLNKGATVGEVQGAEGSLTDGTVTASVSARKGSRA
jgi:hypothetical protein